MPCLLRVRAAAACWLAGLVLAGLADAEAQTPPLDPPTASRDAFVSAMAAARGEPADMLGARFDLAMRLAASGQLMGEDTERAFLVTPRQIFAGVDDPDDAYRDRPLPIGFGQTISAPHMVARMTAALAVAPGDRVLEIGTGSGYQAAMLAALTDAVYTVEIVPPLAEQARSVFADLAAQGYEEYAHIRVRQGDGYFGWEEHAPFDKIIVTAAIDHIPPPLLRQLSVGGRMLIPVGPPMVQVLLQVDKLQAADGSIEIRRRDVYEGRARVVFVPFTRGEAP